MGEGRVLRSLFLGQVDPELGAWREFTISVDLIFMWHVHKAACIEIGEALISG